MANKVLVRTNQGALRGRKVTSETTGKTFYSFQGIPYAKPPIGPLRFKPPEPAEPWEGVRDALAEGNICPQVVMGLNQYVGDEDSLFLNVYAKQWPPSNLKPVMVWIHGGGFILGSGNTDMSGPDYLMQEDIVMVTLNYRLSMLGFLHVEGSDATPNNGLRDQAMALSWIKENISNFGGDPNNITLFGCSAGGASVHYHMLAPATKGTFHRAIIQSGTALFPYCNVSQDVAMARAVRLGHALGANTTQPQKLVDFLRTVEAKYLVLAEDKALSDEERMHAGVVPFLPSEEISNPGAYIPGHPDNLIKRGNFHKIPLIIGVTSAEGKVALQNGFYYPSLKEADDNFERVFNCNVKEGLGAKNFKIAADKIRKFYFGDEAVSDKTILKYVEMQSDLIFNYPFYATVQEQVRHSKAPTYIYQFSKEEKTSASLPGFHPKVNELPGVIHGGEIPYLFSFPSATSSNNSERNTTKHIVKLWTNFATNGNPSEELDVKWPAINRNENLPYMEINDSLTVHENMNKERMNFLHQLFMSFANK